MVKWEFFRKAEIEDIIHLKPHVDLLYPENPCPILIYFENDKFDNNILIWMYPNIPLRFKNYIFNPSQSINNKLPIVKEWLKEIDYYNL